MGMKKERENETIRTELLAWYQEHQRRLPWREQRDPYAIWVSEVMLQQTQVKTVLPYYGRFMARFPTVDALAVSHLDAVLKLWEGLGYYSRARNFHRAAGIVMSEFNGIIPADWKRFKTLPGVGDYIASAVQSIAFGHPHAVVDGNVKRVLSRLYLLEMPVNQTTVKSHKRFKTMAMQLMGKADPSLFNQAMMELGALVCSPKMPLCGACPVQMNCRAYRENHVGDFPVRVRKKPVPTYFIAVGVVQKDEKYLITRRASEGLLGGLWEFPGGKINAGETASHACVREIFEETGLVVDVMTHLTRVKHAYTHFKIEMDVFFCRWLSGDVVLNGPVDSRWISLEEIASYPFPGANHKFIPLLAKGALQS